MGCSATETVDASARHQTNLTDRVEAISKEAFIGRVVT